jgi:AcrR family transcriptional regulator
VVYEPPSPTAERILEATHEVLIRSGPTRLSLSDVAAAADVSRPTLYRWFPNKEDLLDAYGLWEQRKYDLGIAAAIEGLDGDERLDAVLRHVVDFQKNSSLPQIAAVEPGHVLNQLRRVRPIMQQRLARHFHGDDGPILAAIITSIAISHALAARDDPDQFLRELRTAAGLGHLHSQSARRR